MAFNLEKELMSILTVIGIHFSKSDRHYQKQLAFIGRETEGKDTTSENANVPMAKDTKLAR